MNGGISTDTEALYEIKNSLIRFQERIGPLQTEINQVFQKIDEQLADGIKRIQNKNREQENKDDREGRTDSFVCDTCGDRIYLKILGDSTYCRENGCNGTLHRVYIQSSNQRNKRTDELEQIREVVNRYHRQKNEFLQLFSSFISSEIFNVSSGVSSLSSCISILEQYLGTDITSEIEVEKEDRKIKASSVCSYDRSVNGSVDVALTSNLSETFISKLPIERQTAIHTAYAHAPDYIVAVINQYSDQLSQVKDTRYRYMEDGQLKKEGCHYSPEKKYIAMHKEINNAEYVDIMQHELGHFIDDVLERPSKKSNFKKAFQTAVSRFDIHTPEGKRKLDDMLDDAFSTGAAYDRNITDIISALTCNHSSVIHRFYDEDVAYYQHEDGYWLNENVSDVREKESFANIFAIETGSYRISVNFAERWFPEIIEALRISIRGI